ncbi:MAG: hypothetical protein JWO66_936 [Candidatus Eremiobacteraeota bacterium]|nr:hypothetical protein [Candidatus Eremiobacteraeota bacterium]
MRERWYVAVEAVAFALHLTARTRDRARLVHVDGVEITIEPDTARARRDGRTEITLAAAPFTSGGRLYIAVDDVVTVFGAYAEMRGGSLNLWPLQRNADVPSHDVALSGADVVRRHAAHAPGAVVVEPPALRRKYVTGSLHAGLRQRGAYAARLASLQLNAPNWRATADAAGGSGGDSFTGVARFGDARRGIEIGQIPGPLDGEVFGTPRAGGVSVYEPWGRITEARTDDGTTLLGATLERGDAALRGVLLTGAQRDLLLGAARHSTQGSTGVSQEVWIGSHGAAFAVTRRWDGRIFGEIGHSAGSPGLPVATIAHGTHVQLGARISPAWSIVGGETLSRSGTVRYAASTLTAGRVSFGMQTSNHALGFSAASATATSNWALRWNSTGGERSLAGDATFTPRGGAPCEMHLSALSPNRSIDATAECVRRVGQAQLLLGAAYDDDGVTRWIRPAVGLRVALGTALALDIVDRPGRHGRGLQVTLAQAVRFALPARLQRALVDIDGAPPEGADLYIDGRCARRSQRGRLQLALTPGPHRLLVRTPDGTLGSLEAIVDEHRRHAVLALVPLVAVHGGLRYEDGGVGSAPNLGGVTVRLAPGDVTAVTEEDGTFRFPALPLAPGTTVSIDAADVPAGMVARAAPVDARSGSAEVRLGPRRRIERTTF